MLGDKKAGGILVECLRNSAGEPFAIIGLGMNLSVTEFPAELTSTAISLTAGCWAPIDPSVAAETVWNDLKSTVARYRADGFEEILKRYRCVDGTRGRNYRYNLLHSKSYIEGVADGVDTDGALTLRRADGSRFRVVTVSGLIEVKPITE